MNPLPIAVGLLEGLVLYKVWTSESTEKDWVWYMLGAAVGINIILKLGLSTVPK